MSTYDVDPSAIRRLASGRRAYGNLKDEAAGFIRDAIVSGALPPRSKVDQDEIADTLGISRAPVREALIELAQKGFVDAIPRRGAFVADVTVEDIEDHYEVVALVSGMTAKRAVKRLTPAEIAELRRLHQEIAATGDVARVRALDRRFFQLITNSGRSPRLDTILEFLGGALQGSFYFDAPGWAHNEAAYREQMLGAIETGDVLAAARISEEHVRSCAAVTIEHLRTRGYWGGPARDASRPAPGTAIGRGGPAPDASRPAPGTAIGR
ncbi:GntR family transcriptional regulator [Frankia sp. CNm7]|uniref:GntR family transcriptional regulator n=1 Tax=Frankia nepalensis TaxID=1836974 RepID=A0A937RDW4_9ACTN|nr:GntR family transcriptional regulator [Frankia nepalensis]MBL7499997.1 GntR family transcriptional regulator [Frankia nepalensis]MBL7510657.1 GntR family transcriptional regulator [Frankia nepalensis]MBL7520762.1 GntR family transcriptional regulator [Frankia nepalensis]MBL7627190.1 GntR family transcriptional regulator [Frankia nepalensis]